MKTLPRWIPWLAALALWAAAFTLACALLEHPVNAVGADASVWQQLLGAGRTAVSQSLYGEADVYFHGGVRNIEEKAFHGVFERWTEILNPVQHVHAEGSGVYELIPWLQMAIQADPHNVEAWINAAYVTGGMGDRPDIALDLLQEALRHNPRDHRLFAERGHILLRHRDFAAAATAFETGLQLWSEEASADVDAVRDRIRMLTFLSSAYEVLGERAAALRTLRELAALVPDPDRLAARIEALERGEDTRQQALDDLEAILRKPKTCGSRAHDHHHEPAPEGWSKPEQP